MSKKSRRRNKRILGALAAIGTGLALANKGKGMEDANISVGGGKDAATMKMPKIPNRKMGIIPKKNRSFLANPKINKMDLSEVDFDYKAPDMSRFRNMDMGLEDYMPMKKGGRVGCGIAKKGFGKAMKKRSK